MEAIGLDLGPPASAIARSFFVAGGRLAYR
jgi:hypothetical protein